MHSPCRLVAGVLEVLAVNGVEVMIAEGEEYTPTPAVSHAILTHNRGRETGLADGVVITPSHNPPHDGGFKYNPPNGGPAEPVVTGWIEAKANEFLESGLRGVNRIPFEKAASGLHNPPARLPRRLHERPRQCDRHGGHSRREGQLGGRSARWRRCPRLGADCRALRAEPHGRQRGFGGEDAASAVPGQDKGEGKTMSTQTRVSNSMYYFLPREIEGFSPLAELALDMRWSWNRYGDDVWQRLDPDLWELTHNPWVVLQTASRGKLQQMLAEPAFRKRVDALVQTRRQAEEAPAWFQQTYAQSPLTCVAYFSMEFMLSEALPIYSGGLGNVAGDQLKAASDLGIPVVAVGLLYQQGYFRQVIDKDGAQQALFPYNDPGQLPIMPLRQPNGEWLRLEIALPGYSVWLRAWQAQVGRVKLYLLDSNDAANFPAHRGITSELYGGGPELRLKQELLLGIGGWRLLQRAGHPGGSLPPE